MIGVDECELIHLHGQERATMLEQKVVHSNWNEQLENDDDSFLTTCQYLEIYQARSQTGCRVLGETMNMELFAHSPDHDSIIPEANDP